jgi:chromosome segregation ATPase
MTADDRLDQLEPLVSEALNVLDRHTIQLKKLNGAVSQLAAAVAQQGDDISFLLREQVAMKADISHIKADMADMKTDMAGMKTDMAGVQTNMADMKTDMAGMNGKLDLLVQLIQSQNRK